MNHKLVLIAITAFFISCSNDKKTTEVSKQVVKIKSDILLTNSITKPFSSTSSNDTLTLLVTGTSLLKSNTVLKITNSNGDEISCDTIATLALLNPDYRSANSSLKEAQIRETITTFFESEKNLNYFKKDSYATTPFNN